jgi:hypothetical protein
VAGLRQDDLARIRDARRHHVARGPALLVLFADHDQGRAADPREIVLAREVPHRERVAVHHARIGLDLLHEGAPQDLGRRRLREVAAAEVAPRLALGDEPQPLEPGVGNPRPRRRRHEHEPLHSFRRRERGLERHHAAHRHAEQDRFVHAERVEQPARVRAHLVDRAQAVQAAGARMARAVVGQRAVRLAEPLEQVDEQRAVPLRAVQADDRLAA